jgi:hypothetical protein
LKYPQASKRRKNNKGNRVISAKKTRIEDKKLVKSVAKRYLQATKRRKNDKRKSSTKCKEKQEMRIKN